MKYNNTLRTTTLSKNKMIPTVLKQFHFLNSSCASTPPCFKKEKCVSWKNISFQKVSLHLNIVTFKQNKQYLLLK